MSFTYYQCQDCEWDCVLSNDSENLLESVFVACPECHEDCGRVVALLGRPALESDHPEGVDERTTCPSA